MPDLQEPASIQRTPLTIQRVCQECEEEGQRQSVPDEEEEGVLQAKSVGASEPPGPTPGLESYLATSRGAGEPLPMSARAYFEPRFGHDFGGVRVHTDGRAASAAAAIDARAFTTGADVYFAPGRFHPGTPAGDRLLAHELTHVVQQGAARGPAADRMLRRQATPRRRPLCSPPPECPADFCTPLPSTDAKLERLLLADILLATISAAVNPRVEPVWRSYIFGGSALTDFTPNFGADFTASARTAATTTFLLNAMKVSLRRSRPRPLPLLGGIPVIVDMNSRLAREIAEIGRAGSPNEMNFNAIGDIPGNIAGAIGANQAACPAGATPSTINDTRTAHVVAVVTRISPTQTEVVPHINFTVEDTVDLCPGNCGAAIEQIATVPMSRWEATGISGDVPYFVNFPGPATLLSSFIL